eukprot:s1677_g3.t1
MKSRREEKRRSFEDFEGQAWNWSREEPSQASERDAELVAPAAASEQAGRSRQVRSEENFPKKKKNHRGGRSEAKRTACGAERRECQRTNPTVLRENPDAPPGILAKTPPLKLQPGQSRPPSILPLSSTVRCRVLDSAQLFTNVASICTLCTEPCDRLSHFTNTLSTIDSKLDMANQKTTQTCSVELAFPQRSQSPTRGDLLWDLRAERSAWSIERPSSSLETESIDPVVSTRSASFTRDRMGDALRLRPAVDVFCCCGCGSTLHFEAGD